MSLALKILLIIDAVMLVALIAYIVARFTKEANQEPAEQIVVPEAAPAPAPIVTPAPAVATKSVVVEPVKEEPAPVEEVAEEVVEEVAEETAEEVVEEPVAVEEVAAVEEDVADDADDADDVDDDGDDDVVIGDADDYREVIKRIPFSEKMLAMDAKVQAYYNELYNKFISFRKINPRVSSKCASFRLGRMLVAKITVRGKTMKMHLALDVNKFEDNVYFQKDLSSVKAYAEVPFTVKVKSDRGLKNALKLVDALATDKAIESKTRYNAVDAIANLKAE